MTEQPSVASAGESLSSLQKLARNQSPENWAKLLDGLTALFVTAADGESAEAGVLFGDVACRLLDDVGIEDRALLAERVAALNSISIELARRLANDVHRVAAPVLEQSPVLSDQDLIEIVQKMTTDHTVAISKRKALGAKLTDTLVRTNELEILKQVVANPGAKFSDTSFRVIAEKAKHNPELQEKLIDRTDLTQMVLVQISPFLTAAQKKRLSANKAPEPEGLLGSILEEESAKVDQRKRDKVDARVSVMQIQAGETKISDAILEFAKDGRPDAVILVLTGIAGIGEKTVNSAFNNANPSPLMMICRALAVSPDAFSEIAALRAKQLEFDGDAASEAVGGYARLNGGDAERALAALRTKQRAGEDAA